MSGIKSKDRIPLFGACSVMVLGNVIGYVNEWTMYMSVLFAPLAIAVFGLSRYLLYGRAFPETV